MDSIGGYRLVRKLGEGPRAEVHLARADGDDASVVIKQYRPDIGAESVSTEIEALARGVGEHTVALLDVATAPSRQLALVLARLSGGSLGRLLAHRASLAIGEVVGILAPLAETIEGLHAVGVVHGGVRTESVLFDGDGIPVLACFGNAALIQPGLPPALLELEVGPELDRQAFMALARAVLDRADDQDAVAVVVDLLRGSLGSGWGARFGARLRELAEPTPVALRVEIVETSSAIPGRLELRAPVPPPTRTRRRESERRRRAEGPATGAITDLLAGVLDGPRVTAVTASLRAVRTRVWVLAGAVVLALVAALVLVPNGGGTPEAAPVPTATATASPTALATAARDEDPVDAVVGLLESRERCLRERSVLCLDAVGEPGSAALAEDQELVLALQGGGETPPPFTVTGAQVSVVELLGDAVLVALDGVDDGQPAAILLTRGESGWLLRDYLER
jgi:hypothetical protein